MTIVRDNGQPNVFEGFVEQEGAEYQDYYLPMLPVCSTFLDSDFVNSEFVKNIASAFDEKCKGKNFCKVNFDFTKMSKPCLKEVISRAKSNRFQNLFNSWKKTGSKMELDERSPELDPDLIVITECSLADLTFMDNQNLKLSKSDIRKIVEGFEISMLIFIIVYYNMFRFMQRDFAKQYDSQTVESRDFTLIIKHLPIEYHAFTNEQDIKFAIWNELQEAF